MSAANPKAVWVPHLASLPDWRSRAVLARNFRVWRRNWKTSFVPPAMEPVVSFFAFGLGLGAHVGGIAIDGRTVDYATWMAPGLLAYAVFTSSYYEALYGSYVRMFYQKTWDGMLASQVEVRHVVWGEILWAGLRGTMNAAVVAGVLGLGCALGVLDLHWPWLAVLPLLGFVAAWAFAAAALIFTALVPSIDHMNYAVFLVGFPLSLTSGTYFPVEAAGPWLHLVMQVNPLFHLASVYRALLIGGDVAGPMVGLALTAGVGLVVTAGFAHGLLRRRVLGD
ncbi:MAG: hypothetical protein EXR79_07850 [Myxococcales bacterium]|nr:hypothetical protein [Myxococcales bacterium]